MEHLAKLAAYAFVGAVIGFFVTNWITKQLRRRRLKRQYPGLYRELFKNEDS